MGLSAPVLIGAGRGHRFAPAGVRRTLAIVGGRYEIAAASFLRDALGAAHVFFDVGAHTGYFARFALRTMPATGQVVAFEPDPACLARLRALDGPRLTVRSDALGRIKASRVLAGASAALEGVQALVVECHSAPLLRDVLGVVLDAGLSHVNVTTGGDHQGPPTVLARRRPE